jgi:hypothetical protein
MDKVSTDDWIIGGSALLLIIDLVALPWFSIGGGTVAGIPIPSYDLTATDGPDGWLGVLAVITAIVLIADLLVERFSPQTTLPMIGGSRTQTRFVLACVTALFVALKFLFHIHFSLFGFGFWAAIVLTAILVFSTIRANQGQSIMPSGSSRT